MIVSIRTSIFYLETPDPENPSREQRVYCKWDPYYVRSLGRFSSKGVIPPLSPEQEEVSISVHSPFILSLLSSSPDSGVFSRSRNSGLLHTKSVITPTPPPYF